MSIFGLCVYMWFCRCICVHDLCAYICAFCVCKWFVYYVCVHDGVVWFVYVCVRVGGGGCMVSACVSMIYVCAAAYLGGDTLNFLWGSFLQYYFPLVSVTQCKYWIR